MKWRSTIEKAVNELQDEIAKARRKQPEATHDLSTSKDMEELRKEIARMSATQVLEAGKVSSLEELLGTQRKELFGNLSEMEGYFISKLEAIKRGLGGLALKLNYPLSLS